MSKNKNQTFEEMVRELETLKVVREIIPNVKTKAGEAMYSYVLREKLVVKGVNKEIKVDFVAKDMGGYGVLELIFMLSDEAYLSVHEESLKDDKTGEVTSYTVYDIWNQEDDGTVYKYQVKPFRASDKAKLSVILQKRACKLELLRAEKAASEEAEAASKKESAAGASVEDQ